MPKALSEIDNETIQVATNMEASRYSPKTVRNAYGLVHATLQMYRSDLRLNITLPQKIKPRFYIPEKSEIEQIYKKIKGTDLEIPFLLASQCGLRPSEIRGLTTDCICKGTIEIRCAVVCDMKGKERKKPPKSYAGYRTLPIPPDFEKLMLQNAKGKQICELSAKKVSEKWHDFLIENNFYPFRFYDLRHYFASQALLVGIPQKYIAEMMGHSSTNMIEQVYQHTFVSAMEGFKSIVRKNFEQLMNR
ncbi:MAG: site-specific integrase [Eubacterium sp.]|nr:site-specific integrase [Eubacterium sp.]